MGLNCRPVVKIGEQHMIIHNHNHNHAVFGKEAKTHWRKEGIFNKRYCLHWISTYVEK